MESKDWFNYFDCSFTRNNRPSLTIPTHCGAHVLPMKLLRRFNSSLQWVTACICIHTEDWNLGPQSTTHLSTITHYLIFSHLLIPFSINQSMAFANSLKAVSLRTEAASAFPSTGNAIADLRFSTSVSTNGFGISTPSYQRLISSSRSSKTVTPQAFFWSKPKPEPSTPGISFIILAWFVEISVFWISIGDSDPFRSRDR